MLYDSHCHINDEAFKNDVNEVIQAAVNEGVNPLVVIGWDVPSSKKAVELSQTYDSVYAMVGVHPENIDGLSLSVLDEIEKLTASPKVIAIGEIGLDYYWKNNPETKAAQKEWFIAQLKLAERLRLPVSIHSRSATQDTLAILKEYPLTQKGVLHCYSGSLESMKEFAKLGFYFGFDGPITFKNAKEPKRCVEECPIDRLLVETDCPYMTPEPYRGKRNQPAYIPYIAAKMAELKGMDQKEFEKALRDNFERLFSVKL